MKAAIEGREIQQVTLGNFDWGKILEKKLSPLEPEVRDFINDRITG
jgi:hypothetical protein